MYAVIRTGGKQYRVAPGDVIKVERVAGAAGEAVTFAEVLMVGDQDGQAVGAPLVDGASVSATVLEQARAPKIIVFKKKRRKGYRRKNGHQQEITVLRVMDIATGKGGRRAAATASEA
jgi:large subunit ribosomal protein L21